MVSELTWKKTSCRIKVYSQTLGRAYQDDISLYKLGVKVYHHLQGLAHLLVEEGGRSLEFRVLHWNPSPSATRRNLNAARRRKSSERRTSPSVQGKEPSAARKSPNATRPNPSVTSSSPSAIRKASLTLQGRRHILSGKCLSISFQF